MCVATLHLFTNPSVQKKRTNIMSVTNSEHQRLKTRKHKVYERAHSNASSHVWYMCEPCQDQCLENYMGVATLHLFTNPTAQKTNRHHECHKLGNFNNFELGNIRSMNPHIQMFTSQVW